MRRLVRTLSRTASRLLNSLFELCWLVPIHVSNDERIVRAIYSPYHLDKNNRLKSQAYRPPSKKNEISVMRIEHMGIHLCKRKAKSFEKPDRTYKGFAVLRVGAVRDADLLVVDSRRHFCGHADILFPIEELKALEAGEPLPAELGKKFKDLKDALLAASNYIPDPNTRTPKWEGGKLEPSKAKNT